MGAEVGSIQPLHRSLIYLHSYSYDKKAISLISGGLDSALATRLILDQGIEVVGLNFTSPFSSKKERSGRTPGNKNSRRTWNSPNSERKGT
ncbi:MAG: hypothetical protein MZU91_06215 [Desulfosudis oleivorans]|nr:hypothetical protein [Desulfosudis oleivorans]